MANRDSSFPLWSLFMGAGLLVLAFPVLARVWFDYLHHGSSWRQGDWLINSNAGLVRRGFVGDGLIALSDATGITLLPLVLIVQTGLFLGLLLILWRLGSSTENRSLFLLLAASPAFLPIFWAGDVQGIMRKEIFGFLALGCLALANTRPGQGTFLSVLAVVLFTLGCIGNILHFFVAPALIYGLYLLFDSGRLSRSAFRALTGATLVMSLFWMGFAVVFRDVTDAQAICAPLLSRGLEAPFCSGALSWIVAGYVNHLSEVAARLTPVALGQFAVVAFFGIMPVILSFSLFAERRMIALIAAIAFLPMLPLYAITTDWGRWLNISYMSYVFLLFQASAGGRLNMITRPRLPLIYVLLAIALLLTHAHGIGWQVGGAIRSVVSTFTAFL